MFVDVNAMIYASLHYSSLATSVLTNVLMSHDSAGFLTTPAVSSTLPSAQT